MRKTIFTSLIVVLMSLMSSLVWAASQPATLVDDSTQVDTLISLRSLETGVPLYNAQYQDDRKNLWIVKEVLPALTPFKTLSGLTQFKVPALSRCLYTIQDRFVVASCDPADAGSLWQIIPTTLGGVQIKSMRTGTCLSAGDRYSDYRLAPCQEDETKLVSVKRLWIFAPPAIEATLAPAELP